MTATVRAIHIYPWCKEKLDTIKQHSLRIFPQSVDFISLFRLSMHLKVFVNSTLTKDKAHHFKMVWKTEFKRLHSSRLHIKKLPSNYSRYSLETHYRKREEQSRLSKMKWNSYENHTAYHSKTFQTQKLIWLLEIQWSLVIKSWSRSEDTPGEWRTFTQGAEGTENKWKRSNHSPPSLPFAIEFRFAIPTSITFLSACTQSNVGQ